ncbi:esterase/lipase HI [Acrasis kona]|uniref:Esterase/lipase HI n=1 Tax=Acrasis kona TaxID=1008807 RepID=A0AAW2ZD82_9EUKA
MGQKQSAQDHFDRILDGDEENITILQRNGSPTFKKQKDENVKPNRTKYIIIGVVIALLLAFTLLSLNILFAYFVAGSYVFDKIFYVNKEGYHRDCRENTYESFTTNGDCQGVTTPNSANYSRFIVPLSHLETNISFPSRDSFWAEKEENGGTIRGTFYNYDNLTSRPVVIVVHGYKACRMNSRVMLVSAMLWQHKYNVLAIDLRNHGQSDAYTFQKPYITFGSEEHKDVLGAYDYLVTRYRNTTLSQGRPVVSLYGESMGASSALIAFEKERNFTSAFLDSPPCNVRWTVEKRFELMGYNHKFFLSSACATAGIQSSFGCPPFANDPEQSCKDLAQQSNATNPKRIHFEWTRGDMIVPVHNLEVCENALAHPGVAVTKNVMDSKLELDQAKCNDHVYNVFLNTTAYETRLLNFFDETTK